MAARPANAMLDASARSFAQGAHASDSSGAPRGGRGEVAGGRVQPLGGAVRCVCGSRGWVLVVWPRWLGEGAHGVQVCRDEEAKERLLWTSSPRIWSGQSGSNSHSMTPR